MSNRRSFFTKASALTAGLFTGKAALSAQTNPAPVPVTTLDVADLPFTMDSGTKVFNLIAEPVKQTVIPGRTLDLWGFNGSAPGPTIQANEGDRVRIVFDNHLPEATGIHWHGLELPIAMDGVPGVGQDLVPPGGRFVYEFTLHQNGTFFYHPHMAMQEMVGLLGGFIIHPKTAYTPLVHKDFLIALQEYAVLPNTTIPNSMAMEFNWLTFNGKAGPSTTPLVVQQGERIRIRFINMGMDHHPIHLHGFTFWETGREGARQQETAWTRGNTTLVGVAQARDIEFIADRVGDWMLHCHLPHHMMNQMVPTVGPMTRTNPSKVPLYPQDAFMEGPMMAMDHEVNKPETHGLPTGWSGFSGGMMTLLRVMPPEKYNEIAALIAAKKAGAR